jgi:hypothetical protein
VAPGRRDLSEATRLLVSVPARRVRKTVTESTATTIQARSSHTDQPSESEALGSAIATPTRPPQTASMPRSRRAMSAGYCGRPSTHVKGPRPSMTGVPVAAFVATPPGNQPQSGDSRPGRLLLAARSQAQTATSDTRNDAPEGPLTAVTWVRIPYALPPLFTRKCRDFGLTQAPFRTAAKASVYPPCNRT